MARFISDQNKVVFLHESGTYATTDGTGVWIGQVTDHAITDAENKLVNRYLGTASRSYGSIELGPRDVTGNLTYNAQSMMIPFITIGSIYSESGATATTCVHTATQINSSSWQNPFASGTGQFNAPKSFTLEDSKQSAGTGRNFVRTIVGCAPNTTTITATQGEKVVVVCDYIGQTLTPSSGTTTSVTEITTTPYLWDSSTITLAGSLIDTAKEIGLEINQNLTAPHYLNGSRDIAAPYPGNRDNILTVNLDLESDNAIMLYEEYYKADKTFNAVFDLDQDSSTGSQHSIYYMSGCQITTMDNPSASEGLTETSVEVTVQNMNGIEYNTVPTFNPW